MVSVNDDTYLKWEKDKAVKGNFLVKNMEDSTLLFAVRRSYKDPMEVNKSNPDGTVRYYEISHAETGEVLFEYQGFMKG